MVRNWSFAAALVSSLCTTNVEAQKQLGEPFDLGVGESVLITDAGIRVGFDRVPFDSRCANGVVCIWEGNATAQVWGEISENRAAFDLNTNPQFRSAAVYMGFEIRLLNVSPYPEDGRPIDPNDYVVTMVVEREGTLPVNGRTWGAIKALYL